jgi:hypothetical protein
MYKIVEIKLCFGNGIRLSSRTVYNNKQNIEKFEKLKKKRKQKFLRPLRICLEVIDGICDHIWEYRLI